MKIIFFQFIFLIIINSCNNLSINNNDNRKIVTSDSKNFINIPLCCPKKYKLVRGNCASMENKSNIYFPDLLNSTNIFMDEKKMKFIKLSSENISSDKIFNSFVRDPCKGGPKFRLNPEKKKEDEFIFLINASIYLKHYQEIINNTNYCFGYIAGSHFSVIMCLKEQTENNNDNNDNEDNNNRLINTIGMIASVPFFLATLAVYMIIPQLRNLHGCVLINYITCLFIAYLVLSITILCSYYIGDNLCTAVGKFTYCFA